MHSDVPPNQYQGFRPWSDTPPASLKPGESLENRAQKFANVGHGVVYSQAPPAETLRDTTTSARNHSFVEERDYKVPDRRGVSTLWTETATRGKPFLGTTTYEAGFRAPRPEDFQTYKEPEWLTSSKMVAEDAVPRPALPSSYQRDFTGPNRPYLHQKGMAASTNELQEGTPKMTYHVPGFSGHIPINLRNPSVVEQVGRDVGRPTPTHLRLYHRHNVCGYTGHQALHPRNDLGERLTGTFTSTSSGAAAKCIPL